MTFQVPFQKTFTKAFPQQAVDVAVLTYAETLRDTYGASEVWPLVDIAGGVNIPAFVNGARDGTLQGWDLQNAAGPVTGTLAPYSDGSNDYGNIFTSNGATGLADIFNGVVGSIFLWIKYDGVFTNNLRLLDIRQNNSNRLLFVTLGVNDRYSFYYFAGGAFQQSVFNVTDANVWHSLGFSWSEPSNEVRTYFNGSQVGSTLTGLGTFTGIINKAIIGAQDTTPQNVIPAWLAYYSMKFNSVWSPAQFLGMHNDAATAGPD